MPDFDLFTYSSPCQDFSNAGLQRGGEEGSGTRSSLLWECRRAIVAKKPKFLLMENVAALVSQKFIKTFNKWQEELARYGYTNFAQVLNAKDYGVPQNRERIFLVSVLGEAWYNFPQPFKLEKRLKDVLETNVDEKYYLSEKMISCFENRTAIAKEKGNGFRFNPTDGGGMQKP
jgi:DNA (cytosine-5)-methyltransferase 1